MQTCWEVELCSDHLVLVPTSHLFSLSSALAPRASLSLRFARSKCSSNERYLCLQIFPKEGNNHTALWSKFWQLKCFLIERENLHKCLIFSYDSLWGNLGKLWAYHFATPNRIAFSHHEASFLPTPPFTTPHPNSSSDLQRETAGWQSLWLRISDESKTMTG